MAKNHRPKMLGGEIRRLISEMIARGELKDLGLDSTMLSVSEVDVTRDGSYATVYVTAFSYNPGKSVSEEERKELLAALESEKGYIRGVIGRSIKIRRAPELIFKYDNSFEYGAKMDEIFAKLNSGK